MVPAEGIRLSALQTGLLSGWGLFSTLRIYRGVAFALEDHIARLRADAGRLHVAAEEALAALPEAFERLAIRNGEARRGRKLATPEAQADASGGANGAEAFEAMARVYIVRNHGGLLDQPGGREADWLIFTADLRDWGAAAKLQVVPHGRHAAAPLAAVKSLSWAANLALLEQAQREGYDDALLLNERGEVAECTSANLFVMRGGEMLTPALNSGALAGVSRKVILAGWRQEGIPARETALCLKDLLEAEEVFITSSTREVQPVSHINSMALRPPGMGTQRARAIFRRAVDQYLRRKAFPTAATSQAATRGQ